MISAGKESKMHIVVTKGQGCGRTPISAFDNALFEAGIHNYNLLPLSSVIPPGAVVEERKFAAPAGQWGHRLYVVLSHAVTMIPGTEIWAGVGWVQTKDGRGLFVEHTESSRDNIVDIIHLSLADMVAYREAEFGKVQYVAQAGKCVDRPVCALVAAVFRSEGW
jgi:arginine decarboxylase